MRPVHFSSVSVELVVDREVGMLDSSRWKYFADLKEECQLNTEITREQFTEIIQRTFKTRTSLSSSALLETGYFLLNQQLGLVGEEINNSSKISAVSKDIALKFKETGLTLLYGLRGTLPSISLKDEGVTKNLFQLLQYVPNEALECSGDGFELARSDTYFKAFIQKKHGKYSWM